MQKKILILGSEARTAELTAALAGAGYACERVEFAREALNQATRTSFDLAVMCARPADMDGTKLLAQLRSKGRLPILVAAAAGETGVLINLLNAGADDYLTASCGAKELLERVEVQLQRFSDSQLGGALRYKELRLDPASMAVTLRGEPLSLTKQEYRILEMMLSFPPGRVFSKQDFFESAWGKGYVGADKTVNVHICNIRRKIKAITDEEYIETIWGFGFRLA